MTGKPGTLAERFSTKYFMEPNCGCWLWEGSLNANGYGQMRYGLRGKSVRRAHQVSYELHKGEIPHGLDVRHKCGLRTCVNPAHLELGTRKQNMEDAERHGMIARGFKLPQTRLDDEKVKAIRVDARKHKDIAAQYDVHSSYISMLKNGISRKSVR